MLPELVGNREPKVGERGGGGSLRDERHASPAGMG